MTSSARLLFIEDDPDDIELLSRCLHEHNLTDFLMVDSGAKAFSFLEVLPDDELPGVIVVDLNMPGMSGYEVIRMLKASGRYRKIPVFILTTSQRSLLIEEALRQGAAGYYQKPASLHELNLLVQELYSKAS